MADIKHRLLLSLSGHWKRLKAAVREGRKEREKGKKILSLRAKRGNLF